MPPGVHIGLAVFRGSARGRRVVVTLRGDRRARRAAAHRLLPELARETEDVQGAACDRLRGYLQADLAPSEGGRGADALWARLARFEQAWVGEAGALLMASISDTELTARAVVESDGEPGELGSAGRAAGVHAGLFAPEGFGVTLRAYHTSPGDTEPAWRLKPTEVEAARAALALGYYENPRRCTMEDIARVLGITKSAVYHRMHGLEQKAVRRILTHHAASAEQAPLFGLVAPHHVEQGLIHPAAAGVPAWAPGPP